MTLHIEVSEDYVEISGFEDEEYKYDEILATLNIIDDIIYLTLRHENDTVSYPLTFDEVIRISYELDRIARNAKNNT